jgi:TonB family protein
MIMLIAFLAQIALAQNSFAVTHPKPISLPLFYPSDYPVEARGNGWQGTVVADLTIDTNSKVDRCDIVKSSGYKLLDDTTCGILIKRARFHPAKDKSGNPVIDVLRTPPVTWAWKP